MLSINNFGAYHRSSLFCIRERERCKVNRGRKGGSQINLRNVDLPESLIFYGMDTVLKYDYSSEQQGSISVKPGVFRLIQECQEVSTPVILLSEHKKTQEMASILDSVDPRFTSLKKDKVLYYRSSLEEFFLDVGTRDDDNDDYSDLPPTFQGRGVGYAPCPAALLDAIHTILIEPRGFGGSSGFGVKHSESTRSPLPQHCVVITARSSDDNPENILRKESTGSISRARSIASRSAGMRVIYVEDCGLGSCTAEDVSDGIVESLGDEHDWEILHLDDISTPGSFYLNMAQPRDEFGNKVDVAGLIGEMVSLRLQSTGSTDTLKEKSTNSSPNDELDQILADLDPL